MTTENTSAKPSPLILCSIADEIMRSRQSLYSQQSIGFYNQAGYFLVEDLSLESSRSSKLKATLFRNRSHPATDTKCLLFHHGLGSNRLQALPILSHLPKGYAMCAYDLQANGKSFGKYVTYGKLEKDDIWPVCLFLERKYGFKEFVLWGRSMGAVACLLFAQQLEPNCRLDPNRQDSAIVSAMVLDSPFHNFEDIARDIVHRKVFLPNVMLDILLTLIDANLQERFTNFRTKQTLNPFRIRFEAGKYINVPAVFVYSQVDEVVPCKHSERLIREFRGRQIDINSGRFRTIIMNNCQHNGTRPAEVYHNAFKKIDSLKSQVKRHEFSSYKELYPNDCRKINLSSTKSFINSTEKKKGILLTNQINEKVHETFQTQPLKQAKNSLIQESTSHINLENEGVLYQYYKTGQSELMQESERKSLGSHRGITSTLSIQQRRASLRNPIKMKGTPKQQLIDFQRINGPPIGMIKLRPKSNVANHALTPQPTSCGPKLGASSSMITRSSTPMQTGQNRSLLRTLSNLTQTMQMSQMLRLASWSKASHPPKETVRLRHDQYLL